MSHGGDHHPMSHGGGHAPYVPWVRSRTPGHEWDSNTRLGSAVRTPLSFVGFGHGNRGISWIVSLSPSQFDQMVKTKLTCRVKPHKPLTVALYDGKHCQTGCGFGSIEGLREQGCLTPLYSRSVVEKLLVIPQSRLYALSAV